jgi:NitT/TauT family transport system substrate-binding protein
MDVVGLMPLNTVTATDRSTGIVVRQDLITSGRYRQPADLKGLRIAVLTAGGIGNYVVLRALQSAGLTAHDVELSTLSFPDSVAALANGAIDAAHETEPFITRCEEKSIASLAIPASQICLGTPSSVLFAAGDFARQHRTSVQHFLTALLRGQRDYVNAVAHGAGRTEMLASLGAHTSLKDPRLLEKIHLPNVDPNGWVDPAALTALQEYFVTSGLQHAVLASSKVFDRSYVDYALSKLPGFQSR